MTEVQELSSVPDNKKIWKICEFTAICATRLNPEFNFKTALWFIEIENVSLTLETAVGKTLSQQGPLAL